MSQAIEAMRCTYSGPFDFRDPLGQPSRCHLQVFERPAGTLPVAIATELDDNPGTSITNAAEQAASHVWQTLLRHAREGFRWVEHYPARADAPGRYRRAESYDEVAFTLVGPYRVAQPRWTPSSRAAVEALIGQAEHASAPAE